MKAQFKLHPNASVVIGNNFAPQQTFDRLTVFATNQRPVKFVTTHNFNWGQSSAAWVNRELTVSWAVRFNNQDRFYVLGMGDIYARSAWFYSDSSLKYMVKPIVSPLTTVKSLRGVTFRYKPEVPCDSCEGTVTLPNDSTLHYGLIAQEVEQVLPTLVTRNPEGLKLVSYMELVPILLEGMKAQQTQIEELRAEIELLKNK